MRTTRRSDSILYKRHYQFFTGCTDPNCAAWQCYGAKGIKIYKKWAAFKTGFDHFEQWVIDNLGPMPFPDAVIRRIDSTKDIKPGNLEWSTRIVMSNNRTTNMRVRIGRQTKSLADWCRIHNRNFATVWSRIHDYGFTAKEALEI